ncbi:uncharacterized protein LOC121866196 isoform X3 [Homarus americanus]|uniref:uncharacterized protein LOC121866196 isoform X3 n=1 Tax=Homarus americanus TaxID=6706 RepID=UPI001C43F9CA|nr:uncharacterized protein LOC121866196 isoform X3 [Homarus americanus]
MKLFTTTSTLVILVVLGLSLEMVTAEDCDLPTCTVISGQEVRCKTTYEYHPHPTNPNLFVQCTMYGPQVMSCPESLIWSQSSSLCNYDNKPIPKNCNCNNCFLPNPADATTYYWCFDSNGDGVITPHEQACAPGTTYNQAIKRCT